MPTTRIIEAVDVFEYGLVGRLACWPDVPPYQLGFDGFEEGLHHRIVIAVSL